MFTSIHNPLSRLDAFTWWNVGTQFAAFRIEARVLEK
jgi:hypothetical protein